MLVLQALVLQVLSLLLVLVLLLLSPFFFFFFLLELFCAGLFVFEGPPLLLFGSSVITAVRV